MESYETFKDPSFRWGIYSMKQNIDAIIILNVMRQTENDKKNTPGLGLEVRFGLKITQQWYFSFSLNQHVGNIAYCASHVLVQPNFRRYYFCFLPDQAQLTSIIRRF